MRMSLSVCLVLFGLAAFTSVAEDYEIKFTRPSKPGAKNEFDMKGMLSTKNVVKANGKIVKNESVDISMTAKGVTTANKVDKFGREIEYTVELKEFKVSRKGQYQPTDLFPPGTVVTVKQIVEPNGKKHPSYTVNGKELDVATSKIFGIFFDVPGNDFTDDDVFGAQGRKSVGDSWAINSEVAAKGAAASGVKVDPKDIAGKVTLEKVVDVDGVKCLHVTAFLDVAKAGVPGLPPAFKLQHSTVKAKFAADQPVDVTKGILTSSESLEVSFLGSGKPAPNAPNVVVDSTMKRSREAKIKPLN